MNKYEKICVALGGALHAAHLVHQIAFEGSIDSEELECMVKAVLNLSPSSVTDVYGSLDNIDTGLRLLKQLLSQHDNGSQQSITQYLVSLIHLERKFSGDKAKVAKVQKRLVELKEQAKFFDLTHPTLVANLADLYLEEFGSMSFRIRVEGLPENLQNPRNMSIIRTLLLSGLRSIFLWRQVGGNRLNFLFKRNNLQKACTNILD